jgi:hypothetical protein
VGVKIIAQRPDGPPGEHVDYMVVADDTYDVTGERFWLKAWIISQSWPWLEPVWNGTSFLDHDNWWPFNGEQALLDELVPAGEQRDKPEMRGGRRPPMIMDLPELVPPEWRSRP